MNLGVVELGRIMSILLRMNKHRLYLLLRLVLYMPNKIQLNLELYIDWSAQAVNTISERAMWDSSKPIKLLTFKN